MGLPDNLSEVCERCLYHYRTLWTGRPGLQGLESGGARSGGFGGWEVGLLTNPRHPRPPAPTPPTAPVLQLHLLLSLSPAPAPQRPDGNGGAGTGRDRAHRGRAPGRPGANPLASPSRAAVGTSGGPRPAGKSRESRRPTSEVSGPLPALRPLRRPERKTVGPETRAPLSPRRRGGRLR